MIFPDLYSNFHLQYLAFGFISFVMVIVTTVGYLSDRHLYQSWTGKFNPILVIGLISGLGAGLFLYVLPEGWFDIYITRVPERFFVAFLLAICMAFIMILIDFKAIFPKDLNVLGPTSIWYYSAISYAVEILFHVLPISLLIWLVTSLTVTNDLEVVIWISIIVVATLEPIFQTHYFVGKYPAWVIAAVGLHLFVFNIFQLALFKQFDFVAMLSFRLMYYLIWHILWGHYRLARIFGDH